MSVHTSEPESSCLPEQREWTLHGLLARRRRRMEVGETQELSVELPPGSARTWTRQSEEGDERTRPGLMILAPERSTPHVSKTARALAVLTA